MKRTIFGSIFGFITMTGPGLAGDVSNLEVIGFSNDQRVFVFEESGVQDGSGFPYLIRHYVDTRSGQPLQKTPIENSLIDETKGVDDVRKIHAQRVALFENNLGINVPHSSGKLLAFNYLTELPTDPTSISFATEFNPTIPSRQHKVALKVIRSASVKSCDSTGGIQAGFKLIFSTLDRPSDKEKNVIHNYPICSIDYRMGGVYLSSLESQPPLIAVLVAAAIPGFEGPSYRWMAVFKKFLD